MLSYQPQKQELIPTSSLKIVGLGGAGANMLDRAALEGMSGVELLALNTDIRTLSSSVAGEKIQLGRNLTKGLGAGGDPELGKNAILEAETEIRESLRGRKIVFICVGLGGGTGSGAAPVITRLAREEGAFTIVFATMPFSFEGRRRREQAGAALNEVMALSNALVTFDNGRMGELVLAKQGIHEAFASADLMISQCIKAVTRIVIRPGLINIGLDDLVTALKTNSSRCLFGTGTASGQDRAQKALKKALASPLLDKGSLLQEAGAVLVHVAGGEDLTLYEVELLMASLSKNVRKEAHIIFGAAMDKDMKEHLSITLISALPEEKVEVDNFSHQKERKEAPKQKAPTAYIPEEPEPTTAPPAPQAREEQPLPPPQKKTPTPEQPEQAVVPQPPEQAIEPQILVPTEAEEPPELTPPPQQAPTPQREEPQAATSLSPEFPEPEFDVPDETPWPPVEEVAPTQPEASEQIAQNTQEPLKQQPKTPPTPSPQASPEIKDDEDVTRWLEEIRNEDLEEHAEPALVPLKPKPRQKKESAAPVPTAEQAPKKIPRTTKAKRKEEPPTPTALPQEQPKQPNPVVAQKAEPEEQPVYKEPTAPNNNESPIQGEFNLDGGPKGRFEGEGPNLFQGEDIDVPPYLRRKKF